MRGLGWMLACVVSFAGGGALVFEYFATRTPHISTEWVGLVSATAPITFSTEALLKADIPPPDIQPLTGRAKFLSDGSSERLGYKIRVAVPSLDMKRVPEKYLKERAQTIDGAATKRLPIEQVVFEIVFTFVLKDADGFTVTELSSSKQNLESGKVNEFQDLALKSVSVDAAARTKSIVVQLGVERCVTCQGE